MLTPPPDSEDFLSRYPLVPELWLAPHADTIIGEFIRTRLVSEQATPLDWQILTTENPQHLRGPAILVATERDLKDANAGPQDLLSLARRSRPGRPIIYGGSNHRDLLLEAINTWRAFRVIPQNVSRETLIIAINKAFEALHTEYALDLALNEYRAEKRRLEFAVGRLKNAQDQLMRNEKLSIIGRATGTLLATISDNLRQLESFNELTKELSRDPALSTLRESAVDGFNATKSLLNEMAEFAKNKNPNYDFRQQPLRPLIESAVSFCRFDPKTKDREITTKLNESISANIDKYRLFHALINLIKNAIQATKTGDSICIELSQDTSSPNNAIISVTDSGKGMSEDVRSQIFTPFFSTKGNDGLGLGLHMCQLTIEHHGGAIRCDSTLGEGTRFTIRLPVSGPQSEQSATA